MSLKVYNGIKFKSNNIHEILKQLNSMKEHAINNFKNYYTNNPSALLAFINDNFNDEYKSKLADIIRNNGKIDKILHEFGEKVRSSMSKRFVRYGDIYANFIVYIIPYRGKYYGYFISGDIKENENLIYEIADDFHYQNQTDKPNGISTREWSRRAKFWEYVFYEHEDEMVGLEYRILDHNSLHIFICADLLNMFISKYKMGFSTCFMYNTDRPYTDRYSSYVIAREVKTKFKEQYPKFDIYLLDTKENDEHNIMCEFVLKSLEQDIDNNINEVSNIKEVTTTAEEMKNNKREIFYESE